MALPLAGFIAAEPGENDSRAQSGRTDRVDRVPGMCEDAIKILHIFLILKI